MERFIFHLEDLSNISLSDLSFQPLLIKILITKAQIRVSFFNIHKYMEIKIYHIYQPIKIYTCKN